MNNIKDQKNINNFYHTGFLFVISVLTNSLMQNALEVAYKAIPYYFIWGLIGSYRLKNIK